MSAGNVPCRGELEFWNVTRAQMVEQTKQLKRIADALERHGRESTVMTESEIVSWRNPETGVITHGWKVLRAPGNGDDTYALARMVRQDVVAVECEIIREDGGAE